MKYLTVLHFVVLTSLWCHFPLFLMRFGLTLSLTSGNLLNLSNILTYYHIMTQSGLIA